MKPTIVLLSCMVLGAVAAAPEKSQSRGIVGRLLGRLKHPFSGKTLSKPVEQRPEAAVECKHQGETTEQELAAQVIQLQKQIEEMKWMLQQLAQQQRPVAPDPETAAMPEKVIPTEPATKPSSASNQDLAGEARPAPRPKVSLVDPAVAKEVIGRRKYIGSSYEDEEWDSDDDSGDATLVTPSASSSSPSLAATMEEAPHLPLVPPRSSRPPLSSSSSSSSPPSPPPPASHRPPPLPTSSSLETKESPVGARAALLDDIRNAARSKLKPVRDPPPKPSKSGPPSIEDQLKESKLLQNKVKRMQ